MVLGAAATYCPGTQSFHMAQFVALVAVLKDALGQGEQVRSAVGEPAPVTNVPGAQLVNGRPAQPPSPRQASSVVPAAPSSHTAATQSGSRQPARASQFMSTGPHVSVAPGCRAARASSQSVPCTSTLFAAKPSPSASAAVSVTSHSLTTAGSTVS